MLLRDLMEMAGADDVALLQKACRLMDDVAETSLQDDISGKKSTSYFSYMGVEGSITLAVKNGTVTMTVKRRRQRVDDGDTLDARTDVVTYGAGDITEKWARSAAESAENTLYA